MKPIKHWQGLPFHWLLPLSFFCVGLIYLYASPHFEGTDNIPHVGVIKWIAEKAELPVQSNSHEHLYGQEASQPPLYYLLMTPIWRIVDTSDFNDYFQRNPRAHIGVPERLGKRNLVFYRQPYPPDLRGTSLALYIIRLVTLAMGTVTVAAVYQSAVIVLPGNIGFAVLAASLTAFNPKFVFTSVSVSNDNLVNMLAALACWQALTLLRDGFHTRRSILLAILIALATLSKLSGLVLAPAILLAGLWLLRRTRDWRGFCILTGSIALACLLITGWWFARNFILYDEVFGTATMLDFFGRRQIPLSQLLLEEFEFLRVSYWALFGAFSILTHRIFYLSVDALSLVGAVGLVIFLMKNRRNQFMLSVIGFLSILLAIGSAMLIWWSLQTSASMGRLLFPYITSISLLLALGLITLRIPPLFIAAPLFLFAFAAPFVYILPNYTHPPVVDRPPANAVQTLVNWDDINLVGYVLPSPQRWSPGDEIPLTLYWRPLAQSEELLALFLSLINPEGEAVATIVAFPGWGTLPTTWWQPGQIYRDDYILQIPKAAAGYSSVYLHIGWYAYPDGSNIRPTLENGEIVPAYTIPVGALIGAQEKLTVPKDATPAGTVFADQIRLEAFRWLEGNRLELYWRLLKELGGDWRVFAVVFADEYRQDDDNEIILQRDAVPAVALDYLHTGETFVTRHAFEVGEDFAGEHSVYLGWYDHTAGVRLPISPSEDMLKLPAYSFSPGAAG